MTSQPDAPDSSPAPVALSGPANHVIRGYRKVELCKELAKGEKPRAQLAREYGITRGGLSLFAKANAARIDEIREHLDDEFAGLWIADKTRRLESYQSDLERSEDEPKGSYFEHIRVRNEIRKLVAEELGQLPSRNVAVTGEVTHILEAVKLEDLT